MGRRCSVLNGSLQRGTVLKRGKSSKIQNLILATSSGKTSISSFFLSFLEYLGYYYGTEGL